MAVKLVIAVTDNNWFDMLRQKSSLDEVNFWAPSTKNFRALKPGELFLFKPKGSPNRIAGGGIFAHSGVMLSSRAWETFGEANGAKTEEKLRGLVAKNRKDGQGAFGDVKILCRILTQPFFFEERDWIPVPQSWSKNTVSFKTYNADDGEGLAVWDAVNDRLKRSASPVITEIQARYGEPRLFLPRLGQGGFRALVTDAYNRRCAITGELTLPVLEAAHIRPYSAAGKHEASNGLLLRRDIHSLFDAGYVTVTPDLCFKVSYRIKKDFGGGEHYYELHGNPVSLPAKSYPRPDIDALRWHNEHRYLGDSE